MWDIEYRAILSVLGNKATFSKSQLIAIYSIFKVSLKIFLLYEFPFQYKKYVVNTKLTITLEGLIICLFTKWFF